MTPGVLENTKSDITTNETKVNEQGFYTTIHEMTLHKILFVGDLHISDRYSGRHVDYFQDCIDFLHQVTQSIIDNEITHVFLTGDLVGRTTEKNFQTREALMYFMQVLQKWNNLTNKQVYSNRGNHDFGEKLTDFELLTSLGYIKTGGHVDVGATRVHLIDYGDQHREIEVGEDKYNVAVMHSNLQITGVTDWFIGGRDGVELSTLENLAGVDLIIGGHIHDPSVRVVEETIKGHTVSLIYPGNGTRPRYDKNLWESCLGVIIETDEEQVNLSQIEYKLKPVDEIFQKTYEDDKVEEDEEEEEESNVQKIEELAEVLNQLTTYNIAGEADYKTQIQVMGGADEEAVSLALSYVEGVESEFR